MIADMLRCYGRRTADGTIIKVRTYEIPSNLPEFQNMFGNFEPI
jgi:hypothetical protein